MLFRKFANDNNEPINHIDDLLGSVILMLENLDLNSTLNVVKILRDNNISVDSLLKSKVTLDVNSYHFNVMMISVISNSNLDLRLALNDSQAEQNTSYNKLKSIFSTIKNLETSKTIDTIIADKFVNGTKLSDLIKHTYTNFDQYTDFSKYISLDGKVSQDFDHQVYCSKIALSNNKEIIDEYINKIKEAKYYPECFASAALNPTDDIIASNFIVHFVLNFFNINLYAELVYNSCKDLKAQIKNIVNITLKIEQRPTPLMLALANNNIIAAIKLLDYCATLGTLDINGQAIDSYSSEAVLRGIRAKFLEKNPTNYKNVFAADFKKPGLVIGCGNSSDISFNEDPHANYHAPEYFDTIDMDESNLPTTAAFFEELIQDENYMSSHENQYKLIILETFPGNIEEFHSQLFKSLARLLTDDGMIAVHFSGVRNRPTALMPILITSSIRAGLKFGALYPDIIYPSWIAGTDLQKFILTKSKDGFDYQANSKWIGKALLPVFARHLIIFNQKFRHENRKSLDINFATVFPDRFKVQDLDHGMINIQSLNIGEYSYKHEVKMQRRALLPRYNMCKILKANMTTSLHKNGNTKPMLEVDNQEFKYKYGSSILKPSTPKLRIFGR